MLRNNRYRAPPPRITAAFIQERLRRDRDRLPAVPRVCARSAVAALALLAGPGLTACSSPPPASPKQPAVVETSVSTRYYPVRGTTTQAIFAAIDANDLVEKSGQRALGLTSAD